MLCCWGFFYVLICKTLEMRVLALTHRWWFTLVVWRWGLCKSRLYAACFKSLWFSWCTKLIMNKEMEKYLKEAVWSQRENVWKAGSVPITESRCLSVKVLNLCNSCDELQTEMWLALFVFLSLSFFFLFLCNQVYLVIKLSLLSLSIIVIIYLCIYFGTHF